MCVSFQRRLLPQAEAQSEEAWKDLSRLGWLCRRPFLNGHSMVSPGLALASEARKDQRRSQRAAELGLAWPPPPVRRAVGRPPLQQQYEERLYRELMEDNYAALSHLTHSTVPGWWKPKGPLRMPMEACCSWPQCDGSARGCSCCSWPQCDGSAS